MRRSNWASERRVIKEGDFEEASKIQKKQQELEKKELNLQEKRFE